MSNNASLKQPQLPTPATFVSPKITEDHLQLNAALYVRQSTSHQLREHKESTARQYALKGRLIVFGWSDDQVVVIDEDLGVSGTGKAERHGFRHLLKLITEQQVSLVLGLEMSRLARNSKDWHDLFEVCAIYNTLIADEDGVFDPNDPNDRLVLGLKGIIAEMELHTMKVRLERGRLSKARRGELFHQVPVGYVLDEAGLPRFDPDASARHAMQMFFDLFQSLGSSHALFQYLATHNIKLPFRDRGGQIDWRLPGKTTVYGLLKHPLYAGAYGYGRTKNYRQRNARSTGSKHLPPEQWKVFIKDRFPAYITWEQYDHNQRRLTENDSRGGDRTGPTRGGSALLSGIVYCGHCDRRMSPSYFASGRASYYCGRHNTMAGVTRCHNAIASHTLDTFVSEKLIEAIAPAGVELSLQVVENETTRREQLETLHVHRVEQARFATELAARRYKEVDPTNRLVAATLEQEWDAAMRELQAAAEQLELLRNTLPAKFTDEQRRQLLASCADIAALWHRNATIEERKQITRLLLHRVEVRVHNNSERVSVIMHWSGGFESCHEITRTVTRFNQLESYEQLLDRVLGLTLAGKAPREIATILEAENFHSPRSARSISSHMVQKLLSEPRCRTQLDDPRLGPDHWRSADLAEKLGIPEKRLKDWVTRGWATAIQRPHGRAWVIHADEQELKRLKQLARCQTGQGSQRAPKTLRTPALNPRDKR
jgi:DNA invertase Pin-like site-specific DNA recombinase